MYNSTAIALIIAIIIIIILGAVIISKKECFVENIVTPDMNGSYLIQTGTGTKLVAEGELTFKNAIGQGYITDLATNKKYDLKVTVTSKNIFISSSGNYLRGTYPCSDPYQCTNVNIPVCALEFDTNQPGVSGVIMRNDPSCQFQK